MPSKKNRCNARFPPARIKKIMQKDEDVGKVAAAVPVIISRALELFLESLLSKTCEVTTMRNARTLTTSHIKHTISSEAKFDFLKDLVANIADIQLAEEEGDAGHSTEPEPPRPRGRGRPRRRRVGDAVTREDVDLPSSSDSATENADSDGSEAESDQLVLSTDPPHPVASTSAASQYNGADTPTDLRLPERRDDALPAGPAPALTGHASTAPGHASAGPNLTPTMPGHAYMPAYTPMVPGHMMPAYAPNWASPGVHPMTPPMAHSGQPPPAHNSF